VAAAPHRQAFRDDGAPSRLPALTRRRPGCPLKCGSGASVFAWPALRSLPPGAPSAGAKNTFAPSPHNRSHPWRFLAHDMMYAYIIDSQVTGYEILLSAV